jgi:hypothetical protein
LGQAQHDWGGVQAADRRRLVQADGRLQVGRRPRRPPTLWFRRCCVRTRKWCARMTSVMW